MTKSINKFIYWFNTPWEVKRGIYALLWVHFWCSFARNILSAVL